MRTAHLREQQSLGRKAVAVLPVHYPKPLLTAMDVLAVELWGPPGPPRGPAAGRLQPYVCAVVRNALAFLAGGHADALDAVLFPHTCDSVQGLATVAPDFGGWSKPVLRYHHPKGADRPSARAFVRAELEALAAELGGLTGRPLDPGALGRAVALHAAIDAARAELLAERRRLDLDDAALYALLRRGEWLWPEAHLAELRAARERLSPEPVLRGVPLMITGYVPEPMALFAHLRDAGAVVVADDYAAVGRRVGGLRPGADPLAALVDAAFAAPPCPTRGAPQAARMSHLEALYRRSGAAGVIVHVPKFCEPELFDVPAIRARFAALGAPVLVLETELETELSGQTVTRLEAFCELTAARRHAA
ncbi:MAG TPA: 2-hydroxyacyl-CoA dehydratase family protein [Polyangia bacterium]|jgi:benzoyl-CoA reductase/2-hydroxyglutaryl-CoA dehydratase subunit BcrC/BadD/HgdB